MIQRTFYSEIKFLKLEELVRGIDRMEKFSLQDVQVKDLLNDKVLNSSINDIYYNDLYTRGIYLFFNDKNQIRYIGKSKNGFYGRFMSHMDTTPRPFWGWNVILTKLGVERTGTAHNMLDIKEHETSLRELLRYKLVVIEASETELSAQQLGWLEKLLQKAYKAHGGELLLNQRIGKLSKDEMMMAIEDLV
jgi:hypothetical protein